MGDQGDTYGYRSQAEIETWMKKDPIPRFGQQLQTENLIDAAGLAAIDDEVQKLITEAVEFAKEAPYPDPSEIYEHVYP